MKRTLVLLVLVAACHKSSSSADKSGSGDHAAPAPATTRPAYDDKIISPAAKGLKVGVSTLDDVTKAFPNAEVHKDKSLGGSGDETVMYGDKKAINVHGDGLEASIVDNKLVSMYVHGPGLFDWLVSTMDTMPGSKDCPGNRRMGAHGPDAAYCASAGDKVVYINATKGSDSDELNYHLPE